MGNIRIKKDTDGVNLLFIMAPSIKDNGRMMLYQDMVDLLEMIAIMREMWEMAKQMDQGLTKITIDTIQDSGRMTKEMVLGNKNIKINRKVLQEGS